MDNTILEYLEGYLGGQLDESTSDEDIMGAFYDLLETADVIRAWMDDDGHYSNKIVALNELWPLVGAAGAALLRVLGPSLFRGGAKAATRVAGSHLVKQGGGGLIKTGVRRGATRIPGSNQVVNKGLGSKLLKYGTAAGLIAGMGGGGNKSGGSGNGSGNDGAINKQQGPNDPDNITKNSATAGGIAAGQFAAGRAWKDKRNAQRNARRSGYQQNRTADILGKQAQNMMDREREKEAKGI